MASQAVALCRWFSTYTLVVPGSPSCPFRRWYIQPFHASWRRHHSRCIWGARRGHSYNGTLVIRRLSNLYLSTSSLAFTTSLYLIGTLLISYLFFSFLSFMYYRLRHMYRTVYPHSCDLHSCFFLLPDLRGLSSSFLYFLLFLFFFLLLLLFLFLFLIYSSLSPLAAMYYDNGIFLGFEPGVRAQIYTVLPS